MNRVRTGELPWTKLDTLHRMVLDSLLTEFNITGLTEEEKDHWNRVWHRLKPWPDSVAGLTRLKKKYTIAPLSNGNVSLIADMAKNAGLPWDAILGAEVARAYKTTRESYLRTAEILAMRPEEVCLVAAHTSDLAAARDCGLKTVFVRRPLEYGPNNAGPPQLSQDWELSVDDLVELAATLGL